VDMTKMKPAHNIAGHQERSHPGIAVLSRSGAGGVLRQG
jgi:hypothetical protein